MGTFQLHYNLMRLLYNNSLLLTEMLYDTTIFYMIVSLAFITVLILIKCLLCG